MNKVLRDWTSAPCFRSPALGRRARILRDADNGQASGRSVSCGDLSPPGLQHPLPLACRVGLTCRPPCLRPEPGPEGRGARAGERALEVRPSFSREADSSSGPA